MIWTILGSNGNIGNHLVNRLRESGQTVFTPSRYDIISSRKSMGHVIYAIGLTADFRQRPFETVQAHVTLLAELLQQGDFDSLLYLSSTRVYGRSISGSEDAILSVLPQDSSDLYNLSKLMGESLCLQDIRTTVRVARLSNVVGGANDNPANFLPTIIREAMGGHVVLSTALNSVKDYIHIDDVVELLPRIAAEGRERIYNVASGLHTSHAQWIQQIVTKTGCSVEVLPGASSVSFAPIDISRIRSEFNYHPRSVLNTLADISMPTKDNL